MGGVTVRVAACNACRRPLHVHMDSCLEEADALAASLGGLGVTDRAPSLGGVKLWQDL